MRPVLWNVDLASRADSSGLGWWQFPSGLSLVRGSLFCELPPLLPLTLRLQVPLTLPLGHVVSLGKVESPCWRRGLGILVLLGKVEDTLTWEGRVGSQPWFWSPE
ncbi:hypothetical protein LEMLEM_LOCUS3137 [Lemmus lemmus]